MSYTVSGVSPLVSQFMSGESVTFTVTGTGLGSVTGLSIASTAGFTASWSPSTVSSASFTNMAGDQTSFQFSSTPTYGGNGDGTLTITFDPTTSPPTTAQVAATFLGTL